MIVMLRYGCGCEFDYPSYPPQINGHEERPTTPCPLCRGEVTHEFLAKDIACGFVRLNPERTKSIANALNEVKRRLLNIREELNRNTELGNKDVELLQSYLIVAHATLNAFEQMNATLLRINSIVKPKK